MYIKHYLTIQLIFVCYIIHSTYIEEVAVPDNIPMGMAVGRTGENLRILTRIAECYIVPIKGRFAASCEDNAFDSYSAVLYVMNISSFYRSILLHLKKKSSHYL